MTWREKTQMKKDFASSDELLALRFVYRQPLNADRNPVLLKSVYPSRVLVTLTQLHVLHLKEQEDLDQESNIEI